MASDINQIIDPKVIKVLESINKELIAAGTNIDNLIPSINKLNESTSNLGKSTGDSTKTQKDLTESQKEAKKIEDQLLKTEAKIENARTEQNKELQKRKIQLSEINKSIKDEIKLQKAQENSITSLRQRNKELRAEIDKLDLTQESNRDTIQKYNEEINKNNEIIRENFDAVRKAKDNVGNYEESIRAALEGQQAFSGGATNIVQNFIAISQQEGGIKGFFQTFGNGMKAATRAGLKFIATPIGAIIFAIVAAIGLFTSAIKRNQDASDGFGKIWSGIVNVIEEVIGRIFKLAGAIGKLLKGDFKGAFEAGKDAITGFGKAMVNAYNEGQKLRQLQIDLEKNTISATKAIAEYNAEAEKQQIIADDTTRSFAEREAAAEAQRIASINASIEQRNLAQQELEIVNARVKQAQRQGKINRELEQEQADAYAAFIQAEGEYTRTVLENEKLRSELKQDRLERDLDILIDGFDNIKTINERIIADDRQTLAARQALLLETSALAQDSFNKQIETIKQFTNVQFDANELLAEQDAIRLNNKIRELGLSEIIEGRLLEIVRERRIAIQDLNEAQLDLFDTTVDISNDIIDLWDIQDEIDKEYSEYRKERDDEELENFKKNEKKKSEIKKAEEEYRRSLTETTTEIFATAIQAGLNIAKEGSRGQRALLIGQALADKANAVFKIRNATNIAATQALALPLPPPLPQIIAGIYKGLGIAQAIQVISRPIPQFAKGTDFAPGGIALVGEKGRELIQNPRGEIMMANNPALINLERGSKVLSNRKTEAYLNDNNIVSELRQTRKAIQRIPQPIFRNGSKIAERRDKFWINYRNQKHRLN